MDNFKQVIGRSKSPWRKETQEDRDAKVHNAYSLFPIQKSTESIESQEHDRERDRYDQPRRHEHQQYQRRDDHERGRRTGRQASHHAGGRDDDDDDGEDVPNFGSFGYHPQVSGNAFAQKEHQARGRAATLHQTWAADPTAINTESSFRAGPHATLPRSTIDANLAIINARPLNASSSARNESKTTQTQRRSQKSQKSEKSPVEELTLVPRNYENAIPTRREAMEVKKDLNYQDMIYPNQHNKYEYDSSSTPSLGSEATGNSSQLPLTRQKSSVWEKARGVFSREARPSLPDSEIPEKAMRVLCDDNSKKPGIFEGYKNKFASKSSKCVDKSNDYDIACMGPGFNGLSIEDYEDYTTAPSNNDIQQMPVHKGVPWAPPSLSRATSEYATAPTQPEARLSAAPPARLHRTVTDMTTFTSTPMSSKAFYCYEDDSAPPTPPEKDSFRRISSVPEEPESPRTVISDRDHEEITSSYPPRGDPVKGKSKVTNTSSKTYTTSNNNNNNNGNKASASSYDYSEFLREVNRDPRFNHRPSEAPGTNVTHETKPRLKTSMTNMKAMFSRRGASGRDSPAPIQRSATTQGPPSLAAGPAALTPMLANIGVASPNTSFSPSMTPSPLFNSSHQRKDTMQEMNNKLHYLSDEVDQLNGEVNQLTGELNQLRNAVGHLVDAYHPAYRADFAQDIAERVVAELQKTSEDDDAAAQQDNGARNST